MSDLISRRKLLEEIEKYKFGAISNDVERGYVKETILNFIEFQPTAYCVDKVVEELEMHSFEFGTDTLPAHYVRLNKAIEIVKQCGASDAVCEWNQRRTDNNSFLYTSCNNRVGAYSDEFKYCPYCGKKVKVVDK